MNEFADNFDAQVTLETEANPSADDAPFHILLFGDFSGSANRSDHPTAADLRPIEIDRDNFEQVLRKLKVKLELKFEESPKNTLTLDFTELDDFHPDNIFQKISLFANLRELRRKLKNDATYNEAASEVRSWFGSENLVVSNQENQPTLLPNIAGDLLLDQILEINNSTASDNSNSARKASELSQFIGKIVKPHLISTDHEEQSNLLLAIDEIVSDMMRKILHHQDFQALESIWRALYMLVKKIETNASLKIFLMDISKESFSANIKQHSSLTDSGVFVKLEESDAQWACLAALYKFNSTVEDTAFLLRLAKMGEALAAPFFTCLQPKIFGLESLSRLTFEEELNVDRNSAEHKLWSFLRAAPESEYLGLSCQQFLIRLPYGEESDPTETFSFEEFTEKPEHDHFLWANSAFIFSRLMAEKFQSYGWNFPENSVCELNGFPVYFYESENETLMKSFVEINLSEINTRIIADEGLIPLIAEKNTDKLHFRQFTSPSIFGKMPNGKWKRKVR